MEKTKRKTASDYYYRVKDVCGVHENWYSWSEVCSMRREGNYKVVDKILKSEIDKEPLPVTGLLK